MLCGKPLALPVFTETHLWAFYFGARIFHGVLPFHPDGISCRKKSSDCIANRVFSQGRVKPVVSEVFCRRFVNGWPHPIIGQEYRKR